MIAKIYYKLNDYINDKDLWNPENSKRSNQITIISGIWNRNILFQSFQMQWIRIICSVIYNFETWKYKKKQLFSTYLNFVIS